MEISIKKQIVNITRGTVKDEKDRERISPKVLWNLKFSRVPKKLNFWSNKGN